MLPNNYAGQSFNEVVRLIPSDELRHTQRVGRLTNELSWILTRYTKYKKNENVFFKFNNVAFYHDIGKAWAPSDILTKKGCLTNEESLIVRQCPIK